LRKTSERILIFSSALLSGRTAHGLINERANQSTRNDPLRTRDVKHGLSRSFPPLLWISTRCEKDLENFFVRPIVRVVKRQTDELCLAREKSFGAAWPHSGDLTNCPFGSTPHTPVARAVQPRNFAAKMPSRASIS
jgi:hypothetical protein